MFNGKSLGLGALVAVLGGVSAQTAPGLSVQAEDVETLNVTYGTNNVSPAGEDVPRADTANPPNISTSALSGTGILLMVDSDVPRNGTRVELLHWLVSNVTLGSDNSTLDIPLPGEAVYAQPSPPVGDSPHAYTFLLFSQPDDFSVPEEFEDVLETRVFFNTSNFVAAAGLGEPLAANYIRVQNLTGTPTTTFPPPRATNGTGTGSGTGTTSPTSSETSVPGTAPATLLGDRVFWVGVSTALLAGVAAFAL